MHITRWLVLTSSFIALTVQSSHFTAPKVARQPWWPSSHPVNHSQVLRVVLALKRRNMDQLDALFWSISDPNSEGYGNRMSVEAVRALISPGAQAIRAVTTWLQQHGVGEVSVSAHEDYITIGATVGQLEELFGLRFQVYENGDGKRLTRSMDRVVIPEEFADVIAVVQGVADLPAPVRRQRVATGEGDPGARVVTPQVLMDAYNITGHEPQPITGKRNIQSYYQYVQWTNLTGLQLFCRKYLPDVPLDKCTVKQFVGANDNNNPSTESSLDSQYIFAVSGGAETWSYSIPFAADPNSPEDDNFCTSWAHFSQEIFKESPHPFVVSMSYGEQLNQFSICAESEIRIVEEDWKKLGTLGVSIIVASGDFGSGYNGRDGFLGQILYPSWPASSPYVTAVGATSFQYNTGYVQQSVCSYPACDATYGWSGGGFAFNADAPAYQQDTIRKYIEADKGLPPKACWASIGIKRGTPDVSALGWNFNIMDSGSFSLVSGTSASTPTFAGMVTQLNWERMKDAGKTLGFLNPLLYMYPHVFTDIVAGNNDNNDNGFGYEAVEGWDATTGLGVPNFGKMRELIRGLEGREGVKKLNSPLETLPQAVTSFAPTGIGASPSGSLNITVRLSDFWAVSTDGRTLMVCEYNIALLYLSNARFYDVETGSLLRVYRYTAQNADLSDCQATVDSSSFACQNSSNSQIVAIFSRVGSQIELTEFSFPLYPSPPGYSAPSLLQQELQVLQNSGAQKYSGLCQVLTYTKNSDGPVYTFGWQIGCFSFAQNALVLNSAFQPAIISPTTVADVTAYITPDGTAAVVSQGSLTQTTRNCTFNQGLVPVSIANGNVLMSDGLYDLKTCRRIRPVSVNQYQTIYVIDDTFIFVSINLATNVSSVVSYDGKGTATDLVTAALDGRFAYVNPQFFSIGRTALVNLQGKQYMIEVPKEGVPTVTALGRIPSMPSSPFGTDYVNVFDPVIYLRDGSFLIPNVQGGILFRKDADRPGAATHIHTFDSTPMLQVKQGVGKVLYQPLPNGTVIIISETFNPVPP